ncbi:pyridoxamine 5'-phosphate oxidase family protein [Hansschlegelia plantiphila]|uniref:General stress protein n=1 Tax=Hansschlegelia plantiphila TaxID=374655 RepID=A0A9W6J2A8_9HYPH|nr:pyridoxamine 5'-phosphate oxidase family protein [Hansschlegelia plantiphila]GLK69377.1 general stress protein [Hansschlegelia plantiphila]
MAASSDADRVWELVDEISVCMLTSKNGDALHARPMHAMSDPERGEIVFFTDVRAHKDEEIAADPQVCLAFAKPGSNAYVSISGEAEVSDDRAEIRSRFNSMTKTWFPDGPEDPNIRLLKVTPRSGEFWDGTSNPLVVAFEIAKARSKHERPDLGENRKVALG